MAFDTSTLRNLVEVLLDGKKFYEEALEKVNVADFKPLFSRMAQSKATIAGELNAKIVAAGESSETSGSVTGALLHGYDKLRATLSTSPDKQYVAQLEEFEDRIVSAFRDAAQNSDDAETRTLAAKYLPDVLRDHKEMSQLKHRLEAIDHAA